MAVPVTLVPLLIVELLVVMVSGVDGEVLSDPGRQLDLLVDLVQQQVVLLAHVAVAVGAVLAEHLEPCVGRAVPLRTLPES
jgi:hypothetical protein